MIIDNSDCWWYRPININFDENNCCHFELGCRFDPNGEVRQCTLNQLCCHYIPDDGVDDYIRMLLEAIKEN